MCKIRLPAATKQETVNYITADSNFYMFDMNSVDNVIDFSRLCFVYVLDIVTFQGVSNETMFRLDFFTFDAPVTHIKIQTQPSNGKIINLNQAGTASYTPNPDFCGKDSFQYQIELKPGTLPPPDAATTWIPWTDKVAFGTIDIFVNCDKPSCNDISVSVYENSKNNVIDLSKSITNWKSNSGAVIVRKPSYGKSSIESEMITYTPNSGYNGNDLVSYVAYTNDRTSNACNCYITVVPNNPSCNKSSFSVAENSSSNVLDISQYIKTWISPGSFLTIITNPYHGSVMVHDETIIYTPTQQYVGTDTVYYTVTNPYGTSITCPCNITVLPNKPTCSDISVIVYEDSSNYINLSTYITDWTSKSSLHISTPPTHGMAAANNKLIKYSTTNYYGTDSLQYTASNEAGTSSPCNCNITIDPPKPKCLPAKAQFNKNTTNDAIDVSSYITYWTASSTSAITTMPANGAATINQQIITYTPTNDYYGNDSLTYTITNESGSTTCSCVINVLQLLPVCSDLSETVNEGSRYNTIDFSSHITNWSTSVSSIKISTAALHGSTIPSNEKVLYTPYAKYYGSDTFQYTVTNPVGFSTPCNCNITVINMEPKCTNALISVKENSYGNSINLSQYITNWTSGSSITISTKPTNGTASPYNESIIYTPTVGYNGSDVLQYTVTNEISTSTVCKCSITILPIPSCKNNTSTVLVNSSNNSINLSSCITNWDSSAHLTVISQPTYGKVTISGQTASYTPTKDFNGTDSFQYTITNTNGTSAPCFSYITVNTINCINFSTSVYGPTPVVLDLGAKAGSNWGSSPVVTISRQPKLGSAVVSGTKITYTYNDKPGQYNDDLVYSVTNELGSSCVNCLLSFVDYSTPRCNFLSFIMTGSGLSYLSSGSFSLDELVTPLLSGTKLKVATPLPSNGTATLLDQYPNTGTVIRYQPNVGFEGFDTVYYTVTNSYGSCTNKVVFCVNLEGPYNTQTGNRELICCSPCSDGKVNVLEDTVNTVDLSPYIPYDLPDTTLAISKQPSHGTITVSGSREIVYTPNTDFYKGSDTFQYTVTTPGNPIDNIQYQGTTCNCELDVQVPSADCSNLLITNPNVITTTSTDNSFVIDLSACITNLITYGVNVIWGPISNGQNGPYVDPKSQSHSCPNGDVDSIQGQPLSMLKYTPLYNAYSYKSGSYTDYFWFQVQNINTTNLSKPCKVTITNTIQND